MSSSSPQLQKAFPAPAAGAELQLVRRPSVSETPSSPGASQPLAEHGRWNGTAKALLISLRVVGVLLLCGWFLAALFDLGPVMARPLLLLLGALSCWWVVGMLEDGFSRGSGDRSKATSDCDDGVRLRE